MAAIRKCLYFDIFDEYNVIIRHLFSVGFAALLIADFLAFRLKCILDWTLLDNEK